MTGPRAAPPEAAALTPAVLQTAPPTAPQTALQTSQLASSRWALLFGNFAIGCGVMVTAGALNDLVHSLRVSVAVGGQLITIAAVVMALGAPLLAAVVAGFDRRRLLALALLWFAAGHALSACMSDYTGLAAVRALAVLGAAVFTPQAAAAISVMAPAAQRGQAITFIFLGWSVASVLGMPMSAWVGEVWGWRWAFAVVALLSTLAALWVWRALPDGVRPAALTRAQWAQVVTHPALMAVVAVTALSAAGQGTLFAYLAPYYRQVLGASPQAISALFLGFGAIGVVSNVLLSRHIDRLGAGRAVSWLLVSIALSMALWPLAGSVAAMAWVMAPWALGCFASNSAQQARLGMAAPVLAPALIALNSSAMYVGQALGASSGGVILGERGLAALPWAGLAWLAAAIAVSVWAQRRMAAASAAKP